MPVSNDIGYSEYTRMKEEGLERILSLHLHLANNIIQHGWSDPLYYWYDINAGSGNNPNCPGSPLVFLETARRIGLRYSATFIEQNDANHKLLEACIRQDDSVTVLCGDNCELLPLVCGQLNGRRHRFGMIYHDPNGEPNFDLLAEVSKLSALSKIDILVYLSGTTLKRVRCAFRDRDGLLDRLATINKQHWLVRDISTSGPQQWTFLLGTNWIDFPEYKRAGFYRTDGDKGRDILHVLSTTEKEREQAAQIAMFATYTTYAEYLAHPQYKAMRQLAVDRAMGTCER